MIIFGDKAVLKFAVAMVFFACTDIRAMSWSNINERTEPTFDVKTPLSQWPVINPLSTQKELESYQSTWDSKKTLKENQISLINQFIKTCCDFSFKKKKKELGRITIGKLKSGENIIFAEPFVNINTYPNSSEVLIFNEKEKFCGVKASVTTNIFLNIDPLDFTEQMKKELKKCVSKLVKDSVGCEVLRVAISKYKGGTERMPKIAFIPVKNKNIGFIYTTNNDLWRYLKNTRNTYFDTYRKFSKSSKFIMFSPDWFEDKHPGLFLKMNHGKSTEEHDFSINDSVIPKEAIFLHQLIYALNVGEDNSHRQTQLIEKRANSQYFYGNFPRFGDYLITCRLINTSFFLDDSVYRTMYGFTKYGLDLINESSYLAHRYNLIRPMYLGVGTKLKINGKTLRPEEFRKFLNTYLETKGDHDLFRYYLSRKSTIPYPEFGIGRFSCSDMITATEE